MELCRTITVHDSDPTSHEGIMAVLERMNFEQNSDDQDADAVAFYKKIWPDIAIISLGDPAEKELQAIREIIEIDGNAKIISCSSPIAGQMEAALEAGAKIHLHKPLTVKMLKAAVDALTIELLHEKIVELDESIDESLFAGCRED